jgi:hypothetical protein
VRKLTYSFKKIDIGLVLIILFTEKNSSKLSRENSEFGRITARRKIRLINLTLPGWYAIAHLGLD